MKSAAIGVRAHSGWGAVVAVSGDASGVEIVARERVSVIAPKMRGPFQPYHIAERKKLSEARSYLTRSAAECRGFAVVALRRVLDDLRARDYRVSGCAVLLGSGRAMPPLDKILAAHPLLHTAEGIFFRQVFQDAFEEFDLGVHGIRERDLDDLCKKVFGKRAAAARQKISRLGKSLGPPWTTDQKLAALAAWTVLAVRAAKT
jgi:hypothetical protein